MEILFSEEKHACRQQKVCETRVSMNVFLDNGLHAQFGRLVTAFDDRYCDPTTATALVYILCGRLVLRNAYVSDRWPTFLMFGCWVWVMFPNQGVIFVGRTDDSTRQIGESMQNWNLFTYMSEHSVEPNNRIVFTMLFQVLELYLIASLKYKT